MLSEKLRPIMLLQEQNCTRISGYQLFQKNASMRSRSCIAVPEEADFIFMENLSSPDTCTGLLKCQDDLTVLVVSAYMDSNHLYIDEMLTQAVEYAQTKGFECVIGCDSNSQSTLWGNSKSNHREGLVLDFAVEYRLDIANTGSKPTFVRSNTESIIDLTLHSNGLDIDEWEVLDDNMLSDHRLISFCIRKSLKKRTKMSRNLRHANWDKFRESLRKSLCFTSKHYWTEADIENESKHITHCITAALDSVAPMKQRENKHNPLWGNPEFRIQSKKVKAAYKRQAKCPTAENVAKYKMYRQELKSIKRKYEAERWQKFCENISNPSDVAKFAKINCKRHKLQSLKDGDVVRTEASDIVEVLQRAHFPGSNRIYKEQQVATEPNRNLKIDVYNGEIDIVKEMITCEKVVAAISSFASYKTAGPDGFSPVVLKNLPSNVIQKYVELFRASILMKYIPQHWLESTVIFIPKAGRPSYEEAKAFRPITLASFQLKTIEKLMLWRMQGKSLALNPPSRYQHAFRKYYSTDTALSVVVDKIEEGLLNKQATLAVFLDILGAFDSIKQDYVIESMRQKGIETQICSWYEIYLKKRMFSINVGDCNRNFRTGFGVPQGGIISPVAFTLCIDGYLDRLNSDGVRTIAFADDIVTLCTGPDLSTAGSLIQGKLKILEEWSTDSGLAFNVNKTNAMVFTNKTRIKKPRLILCNQEIEYAGQVKYLGVTLTPRLSWKNHIDEKVSACRKLMHMLTNMVRRDFQMSLKSLRWLFTMCVQPKLLYAAHIWACKIDGEKASLLREELRKINALGCRLLAPCWRSTPRITMEILWNLMPLHILAKGTALATFHRIKGLIRPFLKGEIGYQKGHLKDLMSECSENDMLMPVSRKVEKMYWEKGYQVNQFQDMDWTQLLEENQVRYVYTDGSGSKGNFGSGLAIRCNCQIENIASIFIGESRSVYQAELKAIDMAAESMLEYIDHVKRTEFRVDNQSVLSRLRSGLATNELEAQCMDKLVRLNKSTRVVFRWVKSHKGIQGNELADGLAKAGASKIELPVQQETRDDSRTPAWLEEWTGVEFLEADSVEVPMPLSYLKEKVRTYMSNKWINEWNRLRGTKFSHRISKFWLHDPDPETIGREMLKLTRKNASLVVRIISGHNTMKEHQKRTSKNEEDVDMACRLCMDFDETNEHLLECEELKNERLLAFGTTDKRQIKRDWNVRNMAQFCRDYKVRMLLTNADMQ